MDGDARRRKEAVVIRAALVALVAIVAPAVAQVRVIAPYYAVVQAEKAGLHCNDSDRFYRVAETTAGTSFFRQPFDCRIAAGPLIGI